MKQSKIKDSIKTMIAWGVFLKTTQTVRSLSAGYARWHNYHLSWEKTFPSSVWVEIVNESSGGMEWGSMSHPHKGIVLSNIFSSDSHIKF